MPRTFDALDDGRSLDAPEPPSRAKGVCDLNAIGGLEPCRGGRRGGSMTSLISTADHPAQSLSASLVCRSWCEAALSSRDDGVRSASVAARQADFHGATVASDELQQHAVWPERSHSPPGARATPSPICSSDTVASVDRPVNDELLGFARVHPGLRVVSGPRARPLRRPARDRRLPRRQPEIRRGDSTLLDRLRRPKRARPSTTRRRNRSRRNPPPRPAFDPELHRACWFAAANPPTSAQAPASAAEQEQATRRRSLLPWNELSSATRLVSRGCFAADEPTAQMAASALAAPEAGTGVGDRAAAKEPSPDPEHRPPRLCFAHTSRSSNDDVTVRWSQPPSRIRACMAKHTRRPRPA
jgi:hypothetical protein